MMFQIEKLDQQNQPVAMSTLIALGGLGLTAFGGGYVVGKDAANN